MHTCIKDAFSEIKNAFFAFFAKNAFPAPVSVMRYKMINGVESSKTAERPTEVYYFRASGDINL